MADREHQYSGYTLQDGRDVASCFRCGHTRARIKEPLHPRGHVLLYRMLPTGQGFLKELPCTQVEKLLALARGATGNEASSAAYRAITVMREHHLAFFPEPALLQTAQAELAAATMDDQQRAAALKVAKASARSFLVTDVERDTLRREQVLPQRQKELRERLEVTMQKTFRFGRDLMSVFAGHIKVTDGRNMAQVHEEVISDLSALKEETDLFRQEFADLFNGAAAPPKRAVKRPPAKKPVAAKSSTRTNTKKNNMRGRRIP